MRCPQRGCGLAGLWELRDTKRLAAGRPVVLILTSAGIKWPGPIAAIFPGRPLRSVAALHDRLAEPATLHASADA